MIARPQHEWLGEWCEWEPTSEAAEELALVVFRPRVRAMAATWDALFDHALPAAFAGAPWRQQALYIGSISAFYRRRRRHGCCTGIGVPVLE